MTMNLDDFKQLNNSVYKEITINKLDKKIKLKKLGAKERTELEYLFINGIKNSEELFNLKLRAIIASIVDKDNKPVFCEKTRNVVINMDGEVLTEIWRHIQDYNFPKDDDIEDQAKNLQSGL